ncbi:MAG: 16S rRNA (uracil(1498)-N(3))-methyltransferase [Armatimonadetes bacterium]|nr:16S rRNA (uracil(1498)-N(3))-methyltransferase [Armatimonadota bacterium]MDW8026924.1 16S rRNA (uracil(1498)-N(3))-methyltransferase [Armatimonadota bacterium]
MRRFIVPFRLTKENVVLTEDLAHRILHVLRMKVGDPVVLCDLKGNEWLAEISAVGANSVQLKLVEPISFGHQPKVEITLFQGIPKGEKMDFIVQKATELGIQKIVPMFTKRTVVQLSPEKAKSKRERWQRIATAATEQCGGRTVPEISIPTSFKQAVDEASFSDVWLLFYEASEHPLNKAIEFGENLSSVAIMVGPEGGFELSEVEMAKRKGAKVVSLGKRILRTETAAIVAVAIVLYELGLLS